MQILIKSNPYEQRISYHYRIDENSAWNEIIEGELYTEELKYGFFPFVVEKVLDAIINQFRNDSKGKIQILFAGPDDEYNELIQASSTESYNGQGINVYVIDKVDGDHYVVDISDKAI